MAITLDATLAAAQNSQSRKPRVRITSEQNTADIPFDGSYIFNTTTREEAPACIVHSSGRICEAHAYGTSTLGWQYSYSDVDRTEIVGTITFDIDRTVSGIAMVEMPDGNIGIVYKIDYSHTYYFYSIILDVTGTVVHAATLIDSWSHDTFTSNPTLALIDYAGVCSEYPTIDLDHVKATSYRWSPGTTYAPYRTFNPAESLTGGWDSNQWICDYTGSQRLHVDLGSAKTIASVYYENAHHSGAGGEAGVKNFLMYGTNDVNAFINTNWGYDSGWTLLNTSITQFEMHPNINVADPHYFTVTGAAPYRYYAFKCIDNWGHGSNMGIRRIELRSESTQGYMLVYGKSIGGNYYLCKTISPTLYSDWTTEAEVSGLGLDIAYRLNNPSIHWINSEWYLFFDVLERYDVSGAEQTNIYYTTSADASAWSVAEKVTNYDTYSEIGSHPVAVQKIVNQMYVLFTKQMSALHMGPSAAIWPDSDAYNPVTVHFDSVHRKLYCVVYGWAGGFRCVVKIDVDTWTCDKYWDTTTNPAFPSGVAACTYTYCRALCEDEHIFVYTENADFRTIFYLNGEADTITPFYFDDSVTYNVVANVESSAWTDSRHWLYKSGISQIQADLSNDRIWIFSNVDGYLQGNGIFVGYLKLSEISSPEYHLVIYDTNFPDDCGSDLDVWYWADVTGHRIVASAYGWYYHQGKLKVYDMDSGGELYEWIAGSENFPRAGTIQCFVIGDFCYTSLGEYLTSYGQEDLRGLMEVGLVNHTITYYRPTYITADTHHFHSFRYIGNDELLMMHQGFGVAIFNIVSKSWSYYNEDTIPGLTSDGGCNFAGWENVLDYDSVNEMIFMGDPRTHYGNGTGVVAFSKDGFIQQSNYTIGSYSGIAWSFAEEEALVQGYRDYSAFGVADPDVSSAMYVFWTSEDTDGEKSIKWDRDGSSIDLSDYLINDDIQTSATIDGNASTLEFSVSHGHLFDPYNQTSFLNMYLRKGRKLTLQWGEEVSGVTYWQNAGVFFIQSSVVEFERGTYPAMKIKATDQRELWKYAHVYATDYYMTTPELILEDLLTDIIGMDAADIDIPTIDNSITIEHQWIETNADEVITQICNRFGYFYRFDCDGKFTLRKITNSGSIDHTYSDQTKIRTFSPDDQYSDYTNRVTVIGQEMTFTQVIFAEERLAGLSGTIGFWGHKAEKTVWFSQDKQRRAINPRLVVLESAVGIAFQIAGDVDEYLEECPDEADNKYCTVITKCPDLRVPLLVNIIAGLVLCWVPDLVACWGAGCTIAVGRACQQIAANLVAMIVSSIVSYQYDIYARPLGKVRRMLQYTADDTAHQSEIGYVVEQKIEDPLCYTNPDCELVAEFELMVAQMQRKRITITKIANIQDEEGDTIRFIHPYSGMNIDLYVTDIKRKFKKGSDGYFFDEITGWVINQ